MSGREPHVGPREVPKERSRAAVAKLGYPGLDLSRLRPTKRTT